MANGIPVRPGLQPFLRPRAALTGVSISGEKSGKADSYPIVRGAPRFAGTAGLLPGDPRQPQRGLFDIMSQQGYAAPPRPSEDYRFRGFTAPPRPQVPAGYTGFAPPPRPQPAVPAPRQPNLLERIGAIDPTSAAGQALGAAAATGLQLSGYRRTPLTTAEGLGAMMAAGQEAFTSAREREESAREREQKAEIARQQRETDLRLKLMEIEATRGKAAKKEDLDIARLRRDLRKDFNDSSKYFNEAKQFWTDVVNYSKPEQSAAADLALVFSYMKMLDPDSVVREGEQLQVRGLGGLGAEARALLSRLGIVQEGTYEGGMLIIDPTVRKAIREASAARFADLVKGQADLEQFTADEGGRAGLTPDFFKSNLTGNGTLKRPYIVKDLSELPDTAKDGDYAIVDGIFQQIKEAS